MNTEKKAQLIEIIEKIESFVRQKEHFNYQINSLFQVAKAEGFDPKILKQIIKRRKMPRHELEAEQMLLKEMESMLG